MGDKDGDVATKRSSGQIQMEDGELVIKLEDDFDEDVDLILKHLDMIARRRATKNGIDSEDDVEDGES